MKQGLRDYFLVLEVYLLIFFITTIMIIVVVVILSVLRVIRCKQICCLSIFNGYVQKNPIIFAQGTLRIDP